MKIKLKFLKILFIKILIIQLGLCIRHQHYSKKDILQKREEVREMFQHAYNGYLTYATGFDELRPLTCDGVNTWGSYSLTLIDALDTLAVIGNYSEFRRVVGYLVENSNFDNDINVSVFETNIRVVGGLISAHLMSHRAGLIEPGWPCNGPLLRMAEDVARRLLPAFDTNTGMPYGTVNLRHGVPSGETSITCTAGVGTFLVEFGALSRLTGDPIYEEVALNAVYALWKFRSPLGLFGNHIDVQSGRWTAQDAGIGAGVDSFFEYLVKGSIMLNRPDLLEMFSESRKAIDKYLKKEDWYVWVSMNKGHVTLPVFQSLEAFWPGVLSLIGDIEPAMKTFAKYHTVWSQYGFLPEFYNIPNAEATANRESYPLRPELIESAMLLYRATNDQFYLEVGDDMLTSIQHSSRTKCGYATIKNIRNHERDNRMESFFLAETTKYLYLLFDPDNYLHNDGSRGKIFETPNGECVIEAGNYIFNTEAHPIDPSALHCCHDMTRTDIFENLNLNDYRGETFALNERQKLIKEHEEKSNKFHCPIIKPRNANITIDLEFVVEIDSNLTASEKFASQIEKKTKFDNLNESINNINIDIPIKLSEINKNPNIKFKIEKEIWNSMWTSVNKQIVETIKENKNNIQSKGIAELLILLMRNTNITNTNSSNPNQMHFTTLYDEYVAQQIKNLNENLFISIRNISKHQIDTKTELIDLLNLSANVILMHVNKAIYDNITMQPLYPEILETLMISQRIFINSMENATEIYEFIVNVIDDINDDNESMFEILKIIETSSKMKTTIMNDFKFDLHIFKEFLQKVEELLQIIELKKKLSQSLKTIETLSKHFEKSAEELGDSDKVFIKNDEKVTEKDDDIIKIKNKFEEIGIGSVEPINDLNLNNDDIIKRKTNRQFTVKSQYLNENEKIGPKLSSNNLKSYLDDKFTTENSSILSDFLQSILKSTMVSNSKFEPQELLEKIRNRTNSEYMNFNKNWEIFSCKAQTFLQKLQVQGIF